MIRRFLPWMLLGLVGCGIDEHASRTCESDTDCATDGVCYRGFCIEETCAVGTELVCFDGDPALVDPVAIGNCRQGVSMCGDDERFGACLGQVLPRAESCNGEDDDCDARIDELEGSTCATMRPGVCAEGTLVCGEAGATCESITPATDEVCNGEDDDCDGDVDEDLAGAPCFEGAEGCVATEEGFACTGTCRAGVTECDGVALTCVGATVAVSAEDECTTEGDADCDGAVDEGCPCTTGEERTCYGGPSGTAGVGECVSGQQTCTDGVWGACLGERTPSDESCANPGADDDCNGVDDDVALLGASCASDALGACRDGTYACVSEARTCVPPEPAVGERCDGIDEDCDGTVDEGQSDCGSTCCGGGACVDLQSDAMNCGGCLVRCGGGQICSNGGCCAPGQIFCAGGCRNPQTNRDHCGDCGIECADGGLLGIAREECVSGVCR